MSSWFEEYLSTWAGTDVDAVAVWFDDDIVYEDVTLGHKANGIGQMRRFVQGSFDMAPGAHFDFVDGADVGDAYHIEWVMQPMGVRGVSIGTRRDGKIVSNRDYWNGAGFEPGGA